VTELDELRRGALDRRPRLVIDRNAERCGCRDVDRERLRQDEVGERASGGGATSRSPGS